MRAPTELRSTTSMPAAARRAPVASELATALSPSGLPASASIRQLTVEPVPIPIVALRGSWPRAAAAARLFFSSALIVLSRRPHAFAGFRNDCARLRGHSRFVFDSADAALVRV